MGCLSVTDQAAGVKKVTAGLGPMQVVGESDGLQAAVHAQFAQEVLDVVAHRNGADEQQAGDHPRIHAGGQATQHVALLCAQKSQGCWLRWRRMELRGGQFWRLPGIPEDVH